METVHNPRGRPRSMLQRRRPSHVGQRSLRPLGALGSGVPAEVGGAAQLASRRARTLLRVDSTARFPRRCGARCRRRRSAARRRSVHRTGRPRDRSRPLTSRARSREAQRGRGGGEDPLAHRRCVRRAVARIGRIRPLARPRGVPLPDRGRAAPHVRSPRWGTRSAGRPRRGRDLRARRPRALQRSRSPALRRPVARALLRSRLRTRGVPTRTPPHPVGRRTTLHLRAAAPPRARFTPRRREITRASAPFRARRRAAGCRACPCARRPSRGTRWWGRRGGAR